jgi:Uma2 family endonuclease
MAGAVHSGQYTAEEALRLNPPGTWELVDGQFVFMSPAGARHGRMVARISRALCDAVEPRGLGVVLAGDAGFVLRRAPDLVRAPDVAFVRASRVTAGLPSEFMIGPPDLAVEVMSPGDRWSEVDHKAAEFISAGATAVWVIDMEQRIARVISKDESRVIAQDGALTCPELLGDVVLQLADLW